MIRPGLPSVHRRTTATAPTSRRRSPATPPATPPSATALFTTLAQFYGTDDIAFTISSDEFNTITLDENGQPRPLMPRSYTSFSEASDENAQSRIYIGVHFHFDKVEGMNAGT